MNAPSTMMSAIQTAKIYQHMNLAGGAAYAAMHE